MERQVVTPFKKLKEYIYANIFTRMRKLLAFVVLVCLVSAQVFAQSKTYVFATYTYSTNNRLQNLEPLVAHLSDKVGITIKAVSYPTVQSLIEALEKDSVDFAMMNTSGYLVLNRNHPGIVNPLVNFDLGESASTNYGGCLIANKKTGIRSISELKQRNRKPSLSLVGRSSTSGNLVPRLLLNAKEIENPEAILLVNYSGTHKKVVEDVLSGRADVGGCGCAEIDSARKYMSFDEKAVVIDSFNDIPLGPIVYNKNIDPGIIQLMAEQLTHLHNENFALLTRFSEGWTEFRGAKRFKKVSDKEYDDFRNMFGNNEGLWKLID